MPRFALYQHSSGASGVIGFRSAADDRLYLEHYLDLPVERIIATASGAPVTRDMIVEVGQFVVDDREIVGSFFRDLVPFLAGEGYEWVCFTATNKIRSLLRRVGFHGLPITAASEGRIGDTGDHWGSYYDNEPVVIVGNLNDPAGHWCAGWEDLATARKAG